MSQNNECEPKLRIKPDFFLLYFSFHCVRQVIFLFSPSFCLVYSACLFTRFPSTLINYKKYSSPPSTIYGTFLNLADVCVGNVLTHRA